MATSAHCHHTPSFVHGTGAQIGPLPTIQGQPRIAYFITRANGTPVPLIPADELPYTVKLQHVPRVLTPDQTYGLNYIGTSPYTGTTFKLERAPAYDNARSFDCQPSQEGSYARGSCNLSRRQFQAPDSLIRQSFNHSNHQSPQLLSSSRDIPACETSKSWRRSDPVTPSTASANGSMDPAQNAINAILRSRAGAETAERIGYRTQDSTPGPSGKIPDQEKKEWCTYWILHGDCAYVQQGCRYRHEMPDRAKLAEIGINHVPRWWLEQKSAVKVGGDRNALRPAVKPEVWLKARKGSDADSESSSTDSTSSQSSKPTTPSRVVLKTAAKSDVPSSSPSIIQARPSTPTELLIDFVPLIPTLSTSNSSGSSTTSVNSTAPTSEERVVRRSSRTVSTLEPIKFDRTAKTANASLPARSPPKSPANTDRVFVPAGESPKMHIADSKKRAAARNENARTASPNTKPSKTGENLEKLIGEMRKTKDGGSDLSASIHAPVNQSPEPMKRKVRTGCRERRPISAAPPMAVQAMNK